MLSDITLACWNVNSITQRLPHLLRYCDEYKPDIICLQETKCQDGEFPEKAFNEMGLKHLVLNGQKGGHHGVAIASRLPIERIDAPDLCREGHSRVIAAKVAGIEIHNIYLPAGGDVPDPDKNEKFAHKLDFLERLGPAYKKQSKTPRILVGDLNVAPHENDVWSHKQLLKIVSHTPGETERLEASRKQAKFEDIARLAVPDEQKLYTWWSYRAKDWAASNRGRRLDHIWVNQAGLPDTLVDSYKIHLGWRGGWKPSDHAPVSVKVSV